MSMTSQQDNRVLSRKGARDLTDEELKAIAGNGGGTPIGRDITTTVCTILGDGDCD
jgi:hypothetical protein